MQGVNLTILLGTLGKDVELKYGANGNAIANLSVATNEEWKDKNTGQKQQSTDWHRVVIFGRLAEVAGQYLRKGSMVYLQGKNKTRKWQDQNGQDRYTTEVVLNGFGSVMQMLGGPTFDADGNATNASNPATGIPSGSLNQGIQPQQNQSPSAAFDNEPEVPF